MKTNRNVCSPDLLMRYLDDELTGLEREETEKHLAHCPDCRERIRASRALAAVFSEHMEVALRDGRLDDVEKDLLSSIRKRGESGHLSKKVFLSIFLSKRWLVPAAAFATVSLLFFTFFSPKENIPEPSALINSFTAETSSVMILETPKTRQTILWFEERPGQGGDDEGMQQV
jgi:hypothetical protein